MGFFRFRRRKEKRASRKAVMLLPSIENNSSSSLNSYQQQQQQQALPENTMCTMEQIPELLQELAAAEHTGSDQAARVLRKLFAVSEYGVAGASLEETRKEMVVFDDGTLVPALLQFLERCRRVPTTVIIIDPAATSAAVVQQQSQLVSLALLVLNNMSIPVANKRLIALEYGGAAVLSRLLCDDPSCRIVVVILVNLTFCDATLRRDLVYANNNIDLIQALCYAFRVASLTQVEYATRSHLLEDGDGSNGVVRTPGERLSALIAFDQQELLKRHETRSASSYCWPRMNNKDHMFPDTARWCVCAMQNLTRPSNDATNNPAAFALIHTGIVPYLLRCKVGKSVNNVSSSASTNNTSEPPYHDDTLNHPSTWVKETAQDAALFVVMNLATDPSARKFLLTECADTVSLLVVIANYGGKLSSDRDEFVRSSKVGAQLTGFQCMKARMALAYLVGSEGHFGQQAKGRTTGKQWVYDSTTAMSPRHDGNNVLLVRKSEAEHLISALVSTLHRRSKALPGGYSAATFSLKYVLFAIRCLLTQPKNQEQFAGANMELLNALFMIVLGRHALQNVTYIDAEAAEHACFSLYLLSHYGFHACFLPYSLGKDYNVRSIVAKVLTSLKDLHDTTPATHHAASQLLLRLKYLICIDTDATKAGPRGSRRIDPDFCLDSQLVFTVKQVVLAEKVHSGAKPRTDIFNRGIARGSKAGSGNSGVTFFDAFPSALHAVHELSFGSTKVRHVNAIDDIAIANNIANCADCGGENVTTCESYGFAWSWTDAPPPPPPPASRCHSLSMLTLAMTGLPNICGSDTTTP